MEFVVNYLLPDKVYDSIKWFVTVALPTLFAAYAALAAIWGWPYPEQIDRTGVVVYTTLCALMGISGNAGKMVKLVKGE